jgi:hypothetical protein
MRLLQVRNYVLPKDARGDVTDLRPNMPYEPDISEYLPKRRVETVPCRIDEATETLRREGRIPLDLLFRRIGSVLVILFLLVGQAHALVYTSEICGDGYDNASSGYTFGSCPVGWMNAVHGKTGCDKQCPGTDKDRDGIIASLDCDDTNKKIFPGAFSDSACSAGQFKVCKADGTYSVCSATTPSGTGLFLVIDPATGSDANVGSVASPWLTYLPVSQTSLGGYRALQPGDVVFFKTNGSITATWDSDATAGIAYRALWLASRNGTSGAPITFAAYPGFDPTIAPTGCNSTNPCNPVEISASNYVNMINIRVTGSYGDGVLISNNSSFGKFEGMEVYDNNCTEDNNCTGFKLNGGSNSNLIARNSIHDNYERGAASGGNDENDTQIVSFDNNGNNIRHNTIFNTNDPYDANSKSGCIKYKRGDLTGGEFIEGNVFRRCAHGGALATSQRNQTFQYNLVFDSAKAAHQKDWGGTYYAINLIVQFNTFVGINGAVVETGDYATATGITAPSITIRDNAGTDARSSYAADDAWLRHNHYSNDASFTSYGNTTYLVQTRNCYFNSTIDFTSSTNFVSLWGGNADLGSKRTFTTFVSNGFEPSSFITNPTFSSDFVATATNCVGKGFAYTTESSSSSGARRKGQFCSSGRKGQSCGS